MGRPRLRFDETGLGSAHLFQLPFRRSTAWSPLLPKSWLGFGFLSILGGGGPHPGPLFTLNSALGGSGGRAGSIYQGHPGGRHLRCLPLGSSVCRAEMIIPVLRVRKVRLRLIRLPKVAQLVSGENQDLNPGLAPKSGLFPRCSAHGIRCGSGGIAATLKLGLEGGAQARSGGHCQCAAGQAGRQAPVSPGAENLG